MKRHRCTCHASALAASAALVLLAAPWPGGQRAAAQLVGARNIILFVGDGMGFEHVKAGRYFAGTNMVFETFPHQGQMTHWAAGGGTTDSAASGTAMATGRKVSSGVISVARPGDDSELLTVLEYQQSLGRRAGLITTSSITDATPAAFGAHEISRGSRTQIGIDYFTQTRPNVLLGAAFGISTQQATTAGYTVVTDRNQLLAVDADAVTHLSGQFGGTDMPLMINGLGNKPHMTNMTAVALALLAVETNGFFLLVENEHIDTLGHANSIAPLVHEVIALSDAVRTALDWATNRTDTLILVTADHETGGLTVTNDNGPGVVPGADWLTTGHTQTPVPLYAWGADAAAIAQVSDNTHIADLFMPPRLTPAVTTGVATGDGHDVQVAWEVVPGDTYVVGFTTNLVDGPWHGVYTNVPRSTALAFVHTNAPAGACGFYRLTSVP